ncbi:hypothetical protein [Chryseobacterium oncorhynchi]|uniref:Uncharacterized protein n=1 Tax=Chryseobacterium oncorhynchi TaxID=741074 RepID=A0A316WN74_9FLAO|nr:hypothetical protein [Chryseobacterium oncorhynchi]PWN59980.1 hypothetical protein C1638_020650 [Chryseobacterium oncorhynchi]
MKKIEKFLLVPRNRLLTEMMCCLALFIISAISWALFFGVIILIYSSGVSTDSQELYKYFTEPDVTFFRVIRHGGLLGIPMLTAIATTVGFLKLLRKIIN